MYRIIILYNKEKPHKNLTKFAVLTPPVEQMY